MSKKSFRENITISDLGPSIVYNNPCKDVEKEVESLSKDVKTLIEKQNEMKNPTMYFFVNKSLNMNPGKVAAQIAHAQEELMWDVLTCDKNAIEKYKKLMNQNPRTVIVLDAKDSEELYKISSYLSSCEIRSGIYVDEKGEDYLLEPTVLATDYVDKEDPRTKIIFDNFPLYRSYLNHLVECESNEKKSKKGFFRRWRNQAN